MTYEFYRFLFIGGAIMCALMLIVTGVLFFVLKIPRVIGDLSGANARKAIAEIRAQNEGSGVKTYKSSRVNKERGKITDRITSTGKLMRQPSVSGGAMRTEKIETDVLIQQARDAEQSWDNTSVLSDQDAFAPETTILTSEAAPAAETTILSPEDNSMYGPLSHPYQAAQPLFEIEFEITIIHSDVLIT